VADEPLTMVQDALRQAEERLKWRCMLAAMLAPSEADRGAALSHPCRTESPHPIHAVPDGLVTQAVTHEGN
jgi:hypothetical protein